MTASNQSGGVSFLGVLTIVFVVLKLTGNVAWSWAWVLSPVLIPVGIVAVIFGGAVVLALVAAGIKSIIKAVRR